MPTPSICAASGRRSPLRDLAARWADGVLGGRFTDLPIVRAAEDIAPAALRIDPASGLFGLAFAAAGPDGFTGTPTMRRALSMAIDRDALTAAFALPNWRTETRIVGGDVDDLPAASTPDWAGQPIETRRTDALAAIEIWRGAHGAPPVLRVAMPAGPGSRLLFAHIKADWRRIGITAVAVPRRRAGRSAPDRRGRAGEIASWYLRRFSCAMRVPCTPESERALMAARNAPTLAERTVMLREADRLITANAPFIALARPLRWSSSIRGSPLGGRAPRLPPAAPFAARPALGPWPPTPATIRRRSASVWS